MDKVEKALQKLTAKERGRLKQLFTQLRSENVKGLDVKKLKGREDVFRTRKGDLRVIYRVGEKGEVFVLAIERRSEKTYKNI